MATSSRNVYKGRITKWSQMCLLDNTAVICPLIILVLDKIGDCLLELAKQCVLENCAYFLALKKCINKNTFVTGCFPLGRLILGKFSMNKNFCNF